MSVTRDGDRLKLQGFCPIEDAEPLVQALLDGAAEVDLSECTGMHAAVFQALMVFCPASASESALPPEM